MHVRRAVAALFTVGAGFAPLAHAATQEDITEIRAQLKALRDSYEARIGALERKLKEAEARAAAPAAAPVPPEPPSPAPAPSGGASTGIAAFNPAVSVVLQGSYANLSQDPAQYRIAGFSPPAETFPKRGFSLAESELNLSANVDDRFYGTLIASLSPEDTVSVEEAYGRYTAAPAGLAPKFGRFLSGIGYLNSQHQHAWDFFDAPLAYQAFLGGAYRNDGLQVKWVAPTEVFAEVGGEVGNGSAFPGSERDKNGAGSAAGYVHLGGDVGESHSWRAGGSYLHAGGDAPRIAMADFVWKWAPNGNGLETNAKLQGEYFRQAALAGSSSPSSGFYLQGVYQFMPRWRVGLRYDRLDPADEPFKPRRASAMVDWSPSEFSRFRVQLQRAQLVPERTDNELFVQYILTIGAHGAHTY